MSKRFLYSMYSVLVLFDDNRSLYVVYHILPSNFSIYVTKIIFRKLVVFVT